ncbi:MAG: SRPBCC family protein [Planctomycetota bacterium]
MMKFVFAFLLLLLGTYLGGFFLPDHYTVTRDRVIAADRVAVHARINDLRTWPVWSALKPPAESETPSSFEGSETGSGQVWVWGGLGDIKPARLEILTSNPETGIQFQLDLDGNRVHTQGAVEYQDDPGGLRVTMTITGEMATPWSRYFKFLAEKSIGPTFEKSLEGLATAVTAPPAPAPEGDAAGDAAGNAAGETTEPPTQAPEPKDS